ncbi:hypothetical protein BC940DRAFT_330923 [Gongronella butleri]|nr:hypothetical protein BC940DRAFT_330923 [Gongronella butleri]
MGRFQPKKKPTAKAAKAKKSKEPVTFDDFMEDAIEYEEQGERYVSGDRSERNYERAVDMYAKAYALKEDDPDCLYNWGRVLFILVGFFPPHTTPEERLPRVDASIDKFRKALALAGSNKTDVEFNLAQALHLRSELLQESSDIDGAYGLSAIALQEAITMFDSVYEVQEQDYLKQKEPSATVASEKEDGTANGTESAPEASSTPQEASGQDDYETVTQMEATTAYSLIDTLVASGDALTTMASMMAVYPDAKKVFERARDKLDRAERWLADTSESDKEHHKARVQILLKRGHSLCALADRAFLATSQADPSLYEHALDTLVHVTEKLDDKNVEAWCDLGDVYSRYAQAILDDCEQHSKPLDRKTTGKDVWQLYGKAADALATALKIEPKNLQILNKASDVSMARAQLPLPVAEKNQTQLLKNAQFYCKQAVEINGQVLTSGWLGWAYATWALEAWAEMPNRINDAHKIISSWIKRGANEDLFQRLADENDNMDGAFIEWVSVTFFDAEPEGDDDDDDESD